ncbi:MAG: hypothetical protein ACPGYT_10260, partial [Nitrospirales bacterium]
MLTLRISYFVFYLGLFFIPTWTYADPLSGVAILHSLSNTTISTLIPADVRPLVTPIEQETFLTELEGSPPKWHKLHNQPGEE